MPHSDLSASQAESRSSGFFSRHFGPLRAYELVLIVVGSMTVTHLGAASYPHQAVWEMGALQAALFTLKALAECLAFVLAPLYLLKFFRVISGKSTTR